MVGDLAVGVAIVAGGGVFTVDSNGIRLRALTGIGVPPARSVRSVRTGLGVVPSLSSLALSLPQASGVEGRFAIGLIARDGGPELRLTVRITDVGLTARDRRPPGVGLNGRVPVSAGLSGRMLGGGLNARVVGGGLNARMFEGGGLNVRTVEGGGLNERTLSGGGLATRGTGFRATGARIGGLSAAPGPEGLIGLGPVLITRSIRARSISTGLLARSIVPLVLAIIGAGSISSGVRARISGLLGAGERERGPIGRRSTLSWRLVEFDSVSN